MKTYLSILLVAAVPAILFSQQIVTNFQENQDIRWGSLSAQGPSYGFYGQEFEFQEKIKINAISVFIYDHPDHDETAATVNFSIWSFEDKPVKELFLSDDTPVNTGEINGWKTYRFEKPQELEKGRYLFGIGQSKVQGFVAFGDGLAKPGYQSKFWCIAPMEGLSDGTNWADIIAFVKSTGAAPEEVKMMEEAVVMMKIEYN